MTSEVDQSVRILTLAASRVGCLELPLGLSVLEASSRLFLRCPEFPPPNCILDLSVTGVLLGAACLLPLRLHLSMEEGAVL